MIGGGTGIPVILKSLREKMEIAAIVTVADDGGSSGELRKYAAIDTARGSSQCPCGHVGYAKIL